MNTSMGAVKRHIWALWATKLHLWGLEELFASLLEASVPLHLIAAQFIHMGRPMLNGVAARRHIDALSLLLEEPQETNAFIAYLRKAGT